MTTVVLGAPDALPAAIAGALGAELREPRGTAAVEGVVIVSASPPRASSMDTLTAAEWDRLTERPMRWALDALKWARTAVLAHGGRIVMVVPTVGIAGAAHLVPYTTAAEGVRALTKSAARQWASEGIAVNTVAVPVALVASDAGHLVAHMTPPALADDASLVDSTVRTIRFLLQDGIPHLVGATVVVDGGAVMSP